MVGIVPLILIVKSINMNYYKGICYLKEGVKVGRWYKSFREAYKEAESFKQDDDVTDVHYARQAKDKHKVDQIIRAFCKDNGGMITKKP